MNVCERPKELIDIKLDLKNGHGGLHFVEVPRGTVHGLGDILKNEVEINLVFLEQMMLVMCVEG